ncbi:MAG: LytTR family transcriptional regulator [Clostridiales bacterium]|nr:LytTR family transcriptional regulator [Clostridiales bacterium]
MEKLRIVLCDTNLKELEAYAKICRGICEQRCLPAEVKPYTNRHEFMFDMGDPVFSASVSICIIDPANGSDGIPATLRREGYDGIILYLTHSDAPEHYWQAFDAGAYNFVQKSDRSRFLSIFEAVLQSAQRAERQYMAVSYAGDYRRVEVRDILYFETMPNHLINVVYKDGSFQFLTTMQKLEELFCRRAFVRVHRSYLVSVSAIHRVNADSLTLNNGCKILVSKERRADLKDAMLCWQL